MAVFQQHRFATVIKHNTNFFLTKHTLKSKIYQFSSTTPCYSHFQLSRPFSVKSPLQPSASPTTQIKLGAKRCTEDTIDLKLTLNRCSTLTPWNETERRTLFLSDMDQHMNFNFGIISFFQANTDFTPEMVVNDLEIAYRKALVHYDFLSGRLSFCNKQERLEIDCNSAGAGFVVISSELALADLGDDLVYSSPVFRQLETMRPDKCLFVIQVVSFKCGGFAIAISMNHVVFDGWSLQMFLLDLASLLASGSPLSTPYNDRRAFSSTSKFPPLQKPPQSYAMSQDLVTKIFHLNSKELTKLREKAMRDRTNPISKFKVVAAHIWRCASLAKSSETNPNKRCTFHCTVDIRARLKNHQLLQTSYTGVALTMASCTTTRRELEDGPFSKLVEMISYAVSDMTEDKILRAMKSGEKFTVNVFEDVFMSSWMTLGFDAVEYPWGKSQCTCPLFLSDWDCFIIMFSSKEDIGGTNIALTLPEDVMRKFETLFYKLI